MALGVEDKEVVMALLGVSAGLAGLVLVFLGLIISALQSYPGATPAKVLNRYRFITGMVLAAFVIGIVCLIGATLWLLGSGRSSALYATTVGLFAAQIVALLVATSVTVSRLVWGR